MKVLSAVAFFAGSADLAIDMVSLQLQTRAFSFFFFNFIF